MPRQHVRSHIRAGHRVRSYTRNTAAAGGGGILLVVLAFIWLLSPDGPSDKAGPTADIATQHIQGWSFSLVDSSTRPTCHDHAYGQVQQYLTVNPCTALTRALLEATDDQGKRMLCAVAWTDMPSPDLAARLLAMADRPGTGNLTELSKEGGRYPGTPFTGKHYASKTDGRTTVIAQTEPLAMRPSPALLTQVAQHALQITRP